MIATMMTPLSHASLRASTRSARWGAFPAPNVSRTTPRVGGMRKARMVAPVMPGKSRRVAVVGSPVSSFRERWFIQHLTDMRTHDWKCVSVCDAGA